MSGALAIPAHDAIPADGTKRRADDFSRELWIGAALGSALLVGLFGWGSLAHLDAAVITPGVVRAGGSLSAIQTPTGGVVTQVSVANGAHVRAGDVLVEFTNPDTIAQERSLASRVFGLQAEIARLEAGLTGASAIAEVPAFTSLIGEDRNLAQGALARERALFGQERGIMTSEAGLMRDRRAQISHQAAGQNERRSSSERQKQLNAQELQMMQSLLDRGLTTRSRVIALQRTSAAYDGEIGASQAELARLRSQSEEVGMQLLAGREERLRQNSERLRTAQTELQTLLPQWQAARTDRARTVIRAPFEGTISAANMPQAGQVVAPGASLFDVVPTSKGYIVEARISPADAAELAPGQAAKVRLSSFRSATLAPVEGKVERVSADSMENQRTGELYYTAQIRVPDRELRSAGLRADLAGGVRPGTPVEVVVAIRPRTAIEYLTGPLLQRMNRTFSER